MAQASGALARLRSIALRVFLIAVAGVFCYSGWIAFRIVRNAQGDTPRKADVIVVFGAAEYVGRPSPVLKARLDHALSLYRDNMATMVITTGARRERRTVR